MHYDDILPFSEIKERILKENPVVLLLNFPFNTQVYKRADDLFSDVENHYKGKVFTARVDMTDPMAISFAQVIGLSAFPSVVLMNSGSMIFHIEGATDIGYLDQLSPEIDRILSSQPPSPGEENQG